MPKPPSIPDNNGQAPAHLTLKRVAIDTYRENVAYLHRDCAVYRAEGFQALSKIRISNHGHHILAVLNVVDDPNLVSPGQVGLAEQAFVQFDGQDGATTTTRVCRSRRRADRVF